jgi:hypothetical protein
MIALKDVSREEYGERKERIERSVPMISPRETVHPPARTPSTAHASFADVE